MERFNRAKRAHHEREANIGLNPDQIKKLTLLLPAKLTKLSDAEKTAAINYAQDNLKRISRMASEGAEVYPGQVQADESKMLKPLDTFGEIEAGLRILNIVYVIADRLRNNNDKEIVFRLADDAAHKMLGIKSEREAISDYDLYGVRRKMKNFVEKKLGVDRNSKHMNQIKLRPNLEVSDYIYTDLFPFGIVMEEAKNFKYKKSDENEQGDIYRIRSKSISALSELPPHATDIASELLYKHILHVSK